MGTRGTRLTGLLAAVAVVVLLAAGVAVAEAAVGPALTAYGPARVSGTEATAVFRVGDRTVRQVRYADRTTLVYGFVLGNDGRLPVRVTGLATQHPEPRLLRYTRLTDADGNDEFTVGAGERVRVRLSMFMHACETLSARAGSFATRVSVRTSRAGMFHDVVTVELPEQVHTGSPREAFCPRATSTSRSPG
jgi:hypothetical protein